MSHLRYLAIGFLFGVVLMKSEAVSWFRIQEMFRFQSFHMFGILGAAVATAGVLLQVLQRRGVRSAGQNKDDAERCSQDAARTAASVRGQRSRRRRRVRLGKAGRCAHHTL